MLQHLLNKAINPHTPLIQAYHVGYFKGETLWDFIEQSGYSNGMPYYRGYSYARNRDSMGRYSNAYSNKWDDHDKEATRAELMQRIRELDEQH